MKLYFETVNETRIPIITTSPHVLEILSMKEEKNNFQRNYYFKKIHKIQENQDGGVGGHTAPPRTTRTDGKSNGKEVRHQGNKKKKKFIQTGRRGGED